jgi:hypothetical protein
MKQTTEELKAIIASAPEGATHVDGQTYLELTTFQTQMYLGMWVSADERTLMAHQCIKSLDDIREIVKLRERVAELERERETCDFKKLYFSLLKTVKKRDLEQQALGIEDWLESRSKLMYTASTALIVSAVEYHAGDRIKELRKQAQELGE